MATVQPSSPGHANTPQQTKFVISKSASWARKTISVVTDKHEYTIFDKAKLIKLLNVANPQANLKSGFLGYFGSKDSEVEKAFDKYLGLDKETLWVTKKNREERVANAAYENLGKKSSIISEKPNEKEKQERLSKIKNKVRNHLLKIEVKDIAPISEKEHFIKTQKREIFLTANYNKLDNSTFQGVSITQNDEGKWVIIVHEPITTTGKSFNTVMDEAIQKIIDLKLPLPTEIFVQHEDENDETDNFRDWKEFTLLTQDKKTYTKAILPADKSTLPEELSGVKQTPESFGSDVIDKNLYDMIKSCNEHYKGAGIAGSENSVNIAVQHLRENPDNVSQFLSIAIKELELANLEDLVKKLFNSIFEKTPKEQKLPQMHDLMNALIKNCGMELAKNVVTATLKSEIQDFFGVENRSKSELGSLFRGSTCGINMLNAFIHHFSEKISATLDKYADPSELIVEISKELGKEPIFKELCMEFYNAIAAEVNFNTAENDIQHLIVSQIFIRGVVPDLTANTQDPEHNIKKAKAIAIQKLTRKLDGEKWDLVKIALFKPELKNDHFKQDRETLWNEQRNQIIEPIKGAISVKKTQENSTPKSVENLKVELLIMHASVEVDASESPISPLETSMKEILLTKNQNAKDTTFRGISAKQNQQDEWEIIIHEPIETENFELIMNEAMNKYVELGIPTPKKVIILHESVGDLEKDMANLYNNGCFGKWQTHLPDRQLRTAISDLKIVTGPNPFHGKSEKAIDNGPERAFCLTKDTSTTKDYKGIVLYLDQKDKQYTLCFCLPDKQQFDKLDSLMEEAVNLLSKLNITPTKVLLPKNYSETRALEVWLQNYHPDSV